ncbi:hypothetical protein [Streptomyces sp. MUM 178J]|uniref:hypothetical protein n=1 Tax=Streptomyces sp. MUM 178J TaxID=2791991 RepID=UPI001F04AE04|nr:hypothetical protein [Streptomyces sp. MUM 178J]WRQ80336.1 hypothetical protein I3F59_013820 [Streptomyces sp. MUM 178J]
MPLSPFNRRVDVLVAIADAPDEAALAIRLLEARGWSTRSWVQHGSDMSVLGTGQRGLLVEVRVYGARFGAVTAAVREIEKLAQGHQAGLWVVDAALVEHAVDQDHRSVYHVHAKAPEASGLLNTVRRCRSRLGAATTLRVVKRPGRPNIAALSRRLEDGSFTGRSFNSSAMELRVPMGMAGRPQGSDEEAEPVADDQKKWLSVLALLGTCLISLGSGFAAVFIDGPWLLVPVLVPFLLVWPVGRLVTGPREPRMAPKLAWGAMVVGTLTLPGSVLALTVPGSPAEVARAMMVALPLLAVASVIAGAYGVVHAFVHSWFGRHASWLLPALVPALALTLPWLGGLQYTVYLRAGFGIPAEAVSIDTYWRYFAPSRPVGLAAVLLLLWAGVSGWLRYFHLRPRGPVIPTVVTLVVSLIALGLPIVFEAAEAEKAAARARITAWEGRDPAPYFGVRGRLVCVRGMEERIPVFNGPLDSERPLLTFGPSEDRVWLWDPRRAESLSVRLEDVAVHRAVNGRCG